jgi:hypothetical protein
MQPRPKRIAKKTWKMLSESNGGVSTSSKMVRAKVVTQRDALGKRAAGRKGMPVKSLEQEKENIHDAVTL